MRIFLGWIRPTLTVVVLMLAGLWIEQNYWWNWLSEPTYTCQQPPAVNHSGVKVLVYGLAKTGTKSISEYLGRVGLKSYHGTDLKFHVLMPLVDAHYRKQPGGSLTWGPRYIASTGPPAYLGNEFGKNNAVYSAWQATPSEEIAAAMSKCRVEAMAFDGLEKLFWRTYDASPGAKVIMMNWRTFRQYEKSARVFSKDHILSLLCIGFLLNSVHILPWGAATIPFANWLSGGEVKSFMESGADFGHGRETVIQKLLHYQMNARRLLSPSSSGTGAGASTEEEYNMFWKTGFDRIPAEDIFEFDMKKHGLKDLCKFLNISGRPECDVSGPMSPHGSHVLTSEVLSWKAFLALVPYFIFFHWANYRIFTALLNWVIARIQAEEEADCDGDDADHDETEEVKTKKQK